MSPRQPQDNLSCYSRWECGINGRQRGWGLHTTTAKVAIKWPIQYATIVTKFQKFSHFIDDSKQVPAGARRRTTTCVKRVIDSSQNQLFVGSSRYIVRPYVSGLLSYSSVGSSYRVQHGIGISHTKLRNVSHHRRRLHT